MLHCGKRGEGHSWTYRSIISFARTCLLIWYVFEIFFCLLISYIFCFLCSYRARRVPSRLYEPRAAQSREVDFLGRWFIRCIEEKIWKSKFREQVTFHGFDFEYPRSNPLNFSVLVPWPVAVNVGRLSRKFMSWRKIFSSSSVELSVLTWV